ncbi:MAG: isoprenylcysteine carboxylmethyltransferase family protein [Proteobacteria bacterium]|nr:isoprenylcysteine carboxylmethyltransferase family protein [Pseudomonadota bacterium]
MREYYRHLFDPGWATAPSTWIFVIWSAWALSWFVAAIWSRQTAARASFAQEAPYRIVTMVGVVMLFGLVDLAHVPRGWDAGVAVGWVMVALIAAGFAFAWWARIHLGALWSGTITRKQDHSIVTTGPYAIVRHPIYTGLLLAGFATAVARGRWEALIGESLFALGCWMKARQEERFLSEKLGPEYAAYRERVPMLVPFVSGS